LTEQFREWSDQKVKGYTAAHYQTCVEERARDKRPLSKSIGWVRGLNAKKVIMKKSIEVEANLTADDGVLSILLGWGSRKSTTALNPGS
jgi:hypothetical protein